MLNLQEGRPIPMPLSRGKVYLIDDDGDVRLMQRMMLEGDGFTVVGETDNLNNKEDTLDRIKKTEAQVVCLDFEMPGGTGQELFQMIEAANLGIAVIACTAKRDHPDYGHVRLQKPFAFDDFIKTVAVCIQSIPRISTSNNEVA